MLVQPAQIQASTTNATIRWVTDVPTGTRAIFGVQTQPLQLNRRVQGTVGTEHEVQLTDLAPNTTYSVAYGTARFWFATNQFTTPGDPKIVQTTGPPSATEVSPAVKPSSKAKDSAAKSIAPKVPNTRSSWGNMASLQDHFIRHGRDFGAKNADDYAAQAWLFLQRARTEGLPAKRDENGVLRIYDPKTRAFAAYNRDGTTKTYFKAGRRDYFDDQPGQPINLKSNE